VNRAASGLLVCGLALAGSARAEAGDGAAPAHQHQLSLYVRGAGMAYLSDARTVGGVGGGIGVRDTVDDRYLFQADVSTLGLLGKVLAVRAGAGMQWGTGTWRPAALLSLTALVGDHLTFLTTAHPTPIHGPAVSLGVSAAPVRFSLGATQLSLLELGVGVGPELPGAGLALHVGLVEVSASF
jgi:hypothetical protein